MRFKARFKRRDCSTLRSRKMTGTIFQPGTRKRQVLITPSHMYLDR